MTDATTQATPTTIPAACSACWETDRLDPRVIEKRVRALWSELQEKHITPAPGGGAVIDYTDLRTSTVNLVAVTDTAIEVDRLEEALVRLHHFAPSRVLILNVD